MWPIPGTRRELAMSTRGASGWVRRIPTGLPDCTKKRLVVLETFEARHDRMEGFPVPGGPPGSAVDDEIVGILGYLGIEIVLKAAEGGFLKPAFGMELGSAMGSNRHRGTLERFEV